MSAHYYRLGVCLTIKKKFSHIHAHVHMREIARERDICFNHPWQMNNENECIFGQNKFLNASFPPAEKVVWYFYIFWHWLMVISDTDVISVYNSSEYTTLGHKHDHTLQAQPYRMLVWLCVTLNRGIVAKNIDEFWCLSYMYVGLRAKIAMTKAHDKNDCLLDMQVLESILLPESIIGHMRNFRYAIGF